MLGPTVIRVSHSGCGLHTALSAAAHLTPVPLSLYPSFRMSLLLPCLPHLLILRDPLSLSPAPPLLLSPCPLLLWKNQSLALASLLCCPSLSRPPSHSGLFCEPELSLHRADEVVEKTSASSDVLTSAVKISCCGMLMITRITHTWTETAYFL